MKRDYFFVVGAAKSGTTALYEILKQSPDINVSSVKEPHFFIDDARFEHATIKGALPSHIVRTMDDYKNLFQPDGPRLRGDFSPGYLYYPEAVDNIYKFYPKAKIIIMLRNHKQRTISAYYHMKKLGFENLPFMESLRKEREKEWFQLQYVDASIYSKSVCRFIDKFGNSNVLILSHADFKQNFQDTVDRIFNFIGAPTLETYSNINIANRKEAKSHTHQKLYTSIYSMRSHFRKFLPQGLRTTGRSLLEKFFLKPVEIEYELPLDIQELFSKDAQAIHDISGIDLGLDKVL